MNTSSLRFSHSLCRREFVAKSIMATSGAAIAPGVSFRASAAEKTSIPIVVFSKVYQTLKLTYEEAAALTTEAGLDGVDCPVRPAGEVLPERATEDLPRY